MLHGFCSAKSLHRVNFNQTLDKINKQLIITSDSILECSFFGYKNMIHFFFLIMMVYKVLVTEQVNHILSILQHPLRPRSYNTLNSSDHSLNMMIEKQYILGPNFCNNTSQWPNINLFVISTSKDNLRCTIGPRLYIIGKIMIMSKWTIAQVDNSNLNRIVWLDHNILRLEIRMNDIHLMKCSQCFQQL